MPKCSRFGFISAGAQCQNGNLSTSITEEMEDYQDAYF